MGRRFWLVPIAAAGTALAVLGLRRFSSREVSANLRTFSMPSAGTYDLFAGWLFGGLYARVAEELASRRKAGTVLDVGCGPGHLAVHLAQRAPGLTITGADVAPDMVERAAGRALREGVADRVRFEVGDVGALPFADGQFDLVVSTFSLHHWPDPARGLAEIHRVLRPGGKAYIYDMSDGLLRAMHHGLAVAGGHRPPVEHVSDGLLRTMHHGAGSEHLIGASPFGGGEVETFRWPGPLPLMKRLVLERTPG